MNSDNEHPSPSQSNIIKFVTLFSTLVVLTIWAAIRFLHWTAAVYRIENIMDELPVLTLIAFLAVSSCYALVNLFGISLVLILPYPKLIRLQKWAVRYPFGMYILNKAIENKLKERTH